MEAEALVNGVMAGVALLFLASVSALLFKRLRFPYTVGLVVIGVALATFGDGIPGIGESLQSFALGPDLILFVFIPVLIFESAFNTEVHLLLRNIVPALALAVPGLLLSIVIIGFGTSELIGMPLGSALVLGILLSATDPVAVIALFREVGAPKRLAVLVEGESLLNDATAIVVYQIVTAVVVTGIFDTTTVTAGLIDFVIVFVGGLVVGLGFGYLLAISIRAIGEEPLVQIALTAVVAYGAFIVSEHFLHTSGVMAVLGAGLVIGYFGDALYSHRVKEHLEVSWENIAFVANSFIFLLLGLSVTTFLGNVVANPRGLLVPALVVIALALVARALAVALIINGTNLVTRRRPVSPAYQLVMFWGGLRGAVAVALALSLPQTFPFRWQIIDITFAMILFTLLVNGTTMAWLLKRLGLDRPSPILDYVAAYDEVRAKRAALDRLESVNMADMTGPAVTTKVRSEIQAELALADKRVVRARDALGDDAEVNRQLMWLRALTVEGGIYRHRFEDGGLDLGSRRELEWDLRSAERRILSGEHTPDLELPQRLRAERWLRHRRTKSILPSSVRNRLLASTYAQVSAVYAGAREVLDSGDAIVDFCGLPSEELADLRRYYEHRKQMAAEQMSLLEQQVDRIGRSLKERLLYRVARDGERDALRNTGMQADSLPAQVVERLEGLG